MDNAGARILMGTINNMLIELHVAMAPLRKAKDDFARKLDEDEMARVQAERERAEYNAGIKRRTQRHYTKEDCQNYLNIC